MNDLYTKTVLGVIALCLLALVAQGYGGAADGAGSGAGQGVQERYKLVPVAMTRTLLRIDLESGETWFSSMMGQPQWRPVLEPGAPSDPAESAPEPDEAAPSEAPTED